MKIVVFIHSLGGGGAERVTAILANRWAAQGWSVMIVTLASVDQDRYALDTRIARIALNKTSVSRSFFGASIENAKRFTALRRVLKAEEPDVALAMMSVCGVIMAFAAFGLRRVIKVGSERVYPPLHRIGAIWTLLRAGSYALLDAIVVQTDESRGWITRHTAARRVFVIPNPVAWPLPAGAGGATSACLGSPNRELLLSVGRLDRQKGFDLLLDAFSALAPSFPEWDLAIVGDGPQRDELRSRIEALGLADRILLPGYSGSISAWYRSATLYVSSSRFEGFPNALAEAMAHGLAAVSFDCDTGPRDIIRHGVDGLLVAIDDQEGFVGALRRLMQNADERRALEQRAVEVRERFSTDKIVTMWRDLFRELGAPA